VQASTAPPLLLVRLRWHVGRRVLQLRSNPQRCGVTTKRKLARATELAYERATLWAVVRRTSKGEPLCSEKLVEAGSEDQAIKRSRVRGATKARPVLASSQWRLIYQEVGL
jgi:hypothetical protein